MSASNLSILDAFPKREFHESLLRGTPLSKCLFINDILYFKGDGNYSWLITTTGQHYLCSRAISFYESYLVNHTDGFIRTHKKCIINVNGVRSFDSEVVIMLDGYRAPVSRRRKSFVEATLQGIKM
ncbi:MAG: LytTR family transcriptional regulator [Spirosomaceae bacterium]|jgi:DNA-binding LytR/AlgR family response regulator|nr:LytTR family transcriptional regulator [Spirosomataceae bacterium]